MAVPRAVVHNAYRNRVILDAVDVDDLRAYSVVARLATSDRGEASEFAPVPSIPLHVDVSVDRKIVTKVLLQVSGLATGGCYEFKLVQGAEQGAASAVCQLPSPAEAEFRERSMMEGKAFARDEMCGLKRERESALRRCDELQDKVVTLIVHIIAHEQRTTQRSAVLS